MERIEMTPKERFFALLKGEPADRPSVINPVSAATAESAKRLGLDFSEAHTDAESAAALALHSYEDLGFDSVMPYFSVVAEAAALGAEIRWGDERNMPSVRGAVYDEPDQIIIPGDFLDRRSVKCIIRAIEIVSTRHGREALIIGKAMGPWTLCMHLYGMERTLIGTIDDRQKVKEILRSLARVTGLFAAAQLEAGAHMVTVADHCTRNLVGPGVYDDFVMPLHKGLNEMFPGRLILHCCGNTEDRAARFARAGFPLYHFESANDIGNMLLLAGGMKLTGCVNNASTLLAGSAGDVEDSVKGIIRSGIDIVSPECAVPPGTPDSNLRAMTACVKRTRFEASDRIAAL
jgi:[methyl-Co(III) methanol-specific corrinoid protein]:coenzyme M methyltransferase